MGSVDLSRFLIYVFAYFQLCVLYIREQIWKTAYTEEDDNNNNDDGLAYCLFQFLQFFCAGRSLVVCINVRYLLRGLVDAQIFSAAYMKKNL